MLRDMNAAAEGEPPCLLISLANKIGNTIDLVLVSQSPRRREILDMMGLSGKFTSRPPHLDETILQEKLVNSKLDPREYTLRLAEAKAHSLAVEHTPVKTTFYLGSDTIVEIDNEILEKPRDEDQAKDMLRRLSGREHHVHTGVAIYKKPANGQVVALVRSFVDTANVSCYDRQKRPKRKYSQLCFSFQVTFAALSEQDICAYVDSGEPMDKAGSYGIQGIGGQMVRSVTGDFFTVMGLPMHLTSRTLALAIQEEMSK